MDKDYLIQLTKQVYRLTLLFPKKEPLRYKMRELADEILANILRIMNQYESTNNKKNYRDSNSIIRHEAIENLDIIDSFFEIAKDQRWVISSEVLAIQEGYGKIAREIKEVEREEKTMELPELLADNANRLEAEEQVLVVEGKRDFRQERILGILKDRGRAQVWEIQKIFPDITKRTLRRDFEQMLKRGLIERLGERNNTFYQLKSA